MTARLYYSMPKNVPCGLCILRVGLSLVLLWFGTQQLFFPADWISYVPDWAVLFSAFSPSALVLLNGGIEIACGILILLGVLIRTASFLMAVHLALIILSLGYNATAVRDLGLAFGFVTLALAGGGAFTLEYLPKRPPPKSPPRA